MIPFNKYWSTGFDEMRLSMLDKRYVSPQTLLDAIGKAGLDQYAEVIGQSFQGNNIIKLKFGSGKKNVLAWAAMHGNETTSMRGWLDVLSNLGNPEVFEYFETLMSTYTLHFIPMLNPDGAEAFTRRNAMGIDMNRDARALRSPEMQCLIREVDELKPVLAFNLHDQRNIFTDGEKTATISFLAPSIDVERTVTEGRKETMDLIAAAASDISDVNSGGIGRYTDEYYPTAIGERIQQMGIPTVLVECGASKNDPLRQEGRMLNGIILHSILTRHAELVQPQIDGYQNIPINKSNQTDVIIRGVRFESKGQSFTSDISILEELKLIDGDLLGFQRVQDVGDLSHQIGLEEFVWRDTEPLAIIQPGGLANFTVETDQCNLSFNEGIRVRA